jgi:nicotinamide riboside transporter PnuC
MAIQRHIVNVIATIMGLAAYHFRWFGSVSNRMHALIRVATMPGIFYFARTPSITSSQ